MSLFISSINSGSNGNCYYIGNHREAVLVDAGISCRETERRMKRAGLNMLLVKAIFISHEHSDHIRGVEVLSRKYQLPVYITPPTLKQGRLKIPRDRVRNFEAYAEVQVGGLSITPFPKFHDAADPFSFIVKGNGVTIGVLTDIGAPCGHVIKNFSQCHAVFLETNYDEEMLEKGHYPHYLKKRIRSGHGHLSNTQALELFIRHRHDRLSHLLLSHLSKENNRPELVQELFLKHAGQTNIVVASRERESPVFRVHTSPTAQNDLRTGTLAQMTLF
jgi:phosphoribosyl 1,2-cyclic phosphodiesterase